MTIEVDLREKVRNYKYSSPFFNIVLDCLLKIVPTRYPHLILTDLIIVGHRLYGKGLGDKIFDYDICSTEVLISNCLEVADEVGATPLERSYFLQLVEKLRYQPLTKTLI